MKKSFLLFICFLTAALTNLAANGQNDDSAGGVKTVHVWTINAHAKDVLSESLETFNQTIGKEKGITAELRVIGGGNYWDSLEVAFAAGEEPEIAGVYQNTPQYAESGWLVPITEIDGGSEFIRDYEEYLVPNNNVYKGKIYTLPYNVLTSRLVYNKELFVKNGIVDEKGEAKAPETWDDMREAARIITENGKGEEFGYVLPLGWPEAGRWEILNTFCSSVGHAGYDVAAGEYRYADFAPVIEFLIDMQQDGSWFPGYTNIINDNARAMFSEGKIGMKLAMGWDVGVYTNQFPAKMDWGVTTVPTMNARKEYKDFMRVSGSYAITRNGARNSEATFEVFKYLYDFNMLAKLFETEKFLPYNPAIMDYVENKPENTAWLAFGDVKDHFVEVPDPGSSLRIMGETVFQTITRLLVEGDKSAVAAALADTDKRYNKALSEAVEDGLDLSTYTDPSWDIRLK